MSEPTGKKPPGAPAPAPLQMDDSIAHVGVMRAQKRRRTTQGVAKQDTHEEAAKAAPPAASARPAGKASPPAVSAVSAAPPARPPSPAPAAPPSRPPSPAAAPAPPAAPSLPDLSRREADQLVQTQIGPFVAALKTDYSAEHIVFSAGPALGEALGKARRIVRERQELLASRLAGHAGPNVERVEQAWDEAVISLGEITLQEDHWAAEPQSLIGEWRQKLATKPDGERVCVVFFRIAAHALRPRDAGRAVEEEALPAAIQAVLGLVDWKSAASLGRPLTAAEAKKIAEPRQRLVAALAGVGGAPRAHYVGAFHSALGVVATGDPENRFRSSVEDPQLAALFVDLVG